MASVDVSQLSKADHDELCCAYAALLLHDGELEITVSNQTAQFHIFIDSDQLILIWFNYRVTSSLRLLRPQETKLSHTGPPSSPRHLRDKTLRTSSPTSAQLPPLLLPPLEPPLPLLVVPLPPRRRKSQRRKKPPMSTWEASSETITENENIYLGSLCRETH